MAGDIRARKMRHKVDNTGTWRGEDGRVKRPGLDFIRERFPPRGPGEGAWYSLDANEP